MQVCAAETLSRHSTQPGWGLAELFAMNTLTQMMLKSCKTQKQSAHQHLQRHNQLTLQPRAKKDGRGDHPQVGAHESA